MKKLLLLLTLLAAFASFGCGSDETPAAPAKAPEAAPAQKVEQKVQYNEKGERVYKSSGKYKITGSGGQLHQFRENK